MLLDVDLALKVQAVPHFHELVCVARVAVLAGELASPIRVDLPGKGHAWRVAARKQAAVFQRSILDMVAFRQSLSVSCETGDSHQLSVGFGLREERRHCN